MLHHGRLEAGRASSFSPGGHCHERERERTGPEDPPGKSFSRSCTEDCDLRYESQAAPFRRPSAPSAYVRAASHEPRQPAERHNLRASPRSPTAHIKVHSDVGLSPRRLLPPCPPSPQIWSGPHETMRGSEVLTEVPSVFAMVMARASWISRPTADWASKHWDVRYRNSLTRCKRARSGGPAKATLVSIPLALKRTLGPLVVTAALMTMAISPHRRTVWQDTADRRGRLGELYQAREDRATNDGPKALLCLFLQFLDCDVGGRGAFSGLHQAPGRRSIPSTLSDLPCGAPLSPLPLPWSTPPRVSL